MKIICGFFVPYLKLFTLGRRSGVVKRKTKKRRTTKTKRKTTRKKTTTSKTSTSKSTPTKKRKTRRKRKTTRKRCGGTRNGSGVSYRQRRQDIVVMESVRQALGLPEPEPHWSQRVHEAASGQGGLSLFGNPHSFDYFSDDENEEPAMPNFSSGRICFYILFLLSLITEFCSQSKNFFLSLPLKLKL